jgi:hypothetical protein
MEERSGFVEFGAPALLDEGTVVFGADKTDGTEGLYSVHAGLGIFRCHRCRAALDYGDGPDSADLALDPVHLCREQRTWPPIW